VTSTTKSRGDEEVSMRLTGDERVQFDAALRARNLVPPKDVVADGRFHRCDARSKNGKRDGSYIVFGDGIIPAGSIQNFQDGLGPEPWRYQPRGRPRTAAEDVQADKKVEEARKQREAQVAADHLRAAAKAGRLWEAAVPATAEHPYLKRKQVQPCGIRSLYNGAVLVVPARDADGKVHTIQFIDADGGKRFLKGGAKQGFFFQIRGRDDTVYVAEGFATAATIHELTGSTVIVAFDGGNLEPVARTVHERFPGAEIVIAADDDWKREQEANPGLRHARAAAVAAGGSVVVPDFSGKNGVTNRDDKHTDFNDLSNFLGADAVKRSLAATMTPDQCLERQLDANPFAALKDAIAKELADLKTRDRSAFAKLRQKLKGAGVRCALLDEAVEEQEEDDGEELHQKQVDVLLALVKNNDVELFHTEDHTAFAAITVDGHREIHAVKSTEFRRWLRNGYFDQKKSAPSSEAMTSGIATIDALAVRKRKCREVHLRVAELDNRFYIDLADDKWRCIEVSTAGWRICSEPPVLFRRKAGMLPLPVPAIGGSVELLRPFLNIRSEDDFILLVSYALAALTPRAPYPVLAIAGSHGGAKSTLVELLRLLVDPSTTPLRTLPREDRELFIQARNGHLLAFDNLSSLPPWTSDALCRIADGAGFAVRSLFTDDDEVLFGGARPIVLNGIEDFVTRPDLADRTVAITLEEVDEDRRRRKHELLREFDEARPLILGALLDAIACGLRRLPTLHIGRLPRLADFATWATACETACFHEGAFMDAFTHNREESIRTVLEADVVATAVQQFMDIRKNWEGTATELLGHLAAIVGEPATKKKSWPALPHILSGRLKRAAPFLRKRGIIVKWGTSRDHAKERRIYLSWAEKEVPKERPQRPHRPQLHDDNGLAEEVDVPEASAGASAAPAERPHSNGQRPIDKEVDFESAATADAADAISASLSVPANKTGNGGDLPECAQCHAADGKAALFEDEDGEPVWLHMACRRFWLKPQRSPWR
jgi:phage/plasmid primase-like uncharacterized protein